MQVGSIQINVVASQEDKDVCYNFYRSAQTHSLKPNLFQRA